MIKEQNVPTRTNNFRDDHGYISLSIVFLVFAALFIVIQSIRPIFELHSFNFNHEVAIGHVRNFRNEIKSNTNRIEEYTSLDWDVLINFTDYRFRITNEAICKRFRNDDLLAVIIVTSYVGHDALRSAHRQAITHEALMQMGMLRVFLIAEIPPNENFITDRAIELEQMVFGDLVQGTFVENYRHLTYKHIMGLKWVDEYCANAKYLVKIDDDFVYDVFFLQSYLTDFKYNRNHYLLAGILLTGTKAIRQVDSKWYVSRQEYPDNIYPDYLSGWFYISNPKTARALMIESQKIPFFWIDDVYVTGILALKLGIQLQKCNSWFSIFKESLYSCDYHGSPNRDEIKLIVKYTKAMHQCHSVS